MIQILSLDSYGHVLILCMPFLHVFLKLYQRKSEICVIVLKWFKLLKVKHNAFLVNFGVHLFKIAMPLRADKIVVNQPNSDIIL